MSVQVKNRHSIVFLVSKLKLELSKKPRVIMNENGTQNDESEVVDEPTQTSSHENTMFESYDPAEPKSKEEWGSLLIEATEKSQLHTISMKDHNYVWLLLINYAHLTENPKENLLNCCTIAINTMPIPAKLTDPERKVNEWKTFLEILYNKLFDGEIQYDEAKSVIEVAEKKFGCSPLLGHVFWASRKAFLTKYLQNKGMSKEEINLQLVEMYKKQFSHPYLKIENDWNSFTRYCKKEEIDQETKTAIQGLYYSVTAESQKLSDLYEPEQDDPVICDHLEFDRLVKEFLTREISEDDQSITFENVQNSIVAVCEEMLTTSQHMLCHYIVYLQALSDNMFKDKPERKQMILNVINRGFLHGKTFCSQNLLAQFIESVLLIATKHFDVKELTELMSLIREEVTVDNSAWFSSRRAILACARNVLLSGLITTNDFKDLFKKTIHPFTLDFYLKNTIPSEFSQRENYEPKLMDLFKIYMTTLNNVENVSWEAAVEKWNDSFAYNNNPIMLLAFVRFMRANGSNADWEKSYNTVLQRLENINDVEATPTSRKCHIQLLMDRQRFLMTVSGVDEQLKISQELFSVNSMYSVLFKESYNLHYTDDDLLTTEISEPWVPIEHATEPKEVLTEAITTNLQNTTIRSSPLPERTFKSPEDGVGEPEGHAMFISNLSFKAKDQDIIAAFAERDIEIVRLDLKKNPRGQHLGYGTLFLSSKNEVDRAVMTMDRMEIAGRQAFLSYFKEDKRTKPREEDKQPTLLVISDIPEEWRNPKKIENALAPYGHIKSISVQDKTEQYSVRVEFHMGSDAANAYAEWQRGVIFEGVELKIRKSFVGMKRQHPAHKGDDKGKADKKITGSTSSDRGQVTKSTHFPRRPIVSGPTPKSRPFVPSAFIPQQVMRSNAHMRQKLEMPGKTSTKDSPSEHKSEKSEIEEKIDKI